MPYPPIIPPPIRTNATPQVDYHPTDHNQISEALTEIVNKIGTLETTLTPAVSTYNPNCAFGGNPGNVQSYGWSRIEPGGMLDVVIRWRLYGTTSVGLFTAALPVPVHSDMMLTDGCAHDAVIGQASMIQSGVNWFHARAYVVYSTPSFVRVDVSAAPGPRDPMRANSPWVWKGDDGGELTLRYRAAT